MNLTAMGFRFVSLNSNSKLIHVNILLICPLTIGLVLVSWGGVRLSLLGMSATVRPTVPVPVDR
jgi:hypothetical protein